MHGVELVDAYQWLEDSRSIDRQFAVQCTKFA